MNEFIPFYENPYNKSVQREKEENVFKPLYTIENHQSVVSMQNRSVTYRHKSRIIMNHE